VHPEDSWAFSGASDGCVEGHPWTHPTGTPDSGRPITTPARWMARMGPPSGTTMRKICFLLRGTWLRAMGLQVCPVNDCATSSPTHPSPRPSDPTTSLLASITRKRCRQTLPGGREQEQLSSLAQPNYQLLRYRRRCPGRIVPPFGPLGGSIVSALRDMLGGLVPR
jgi:hypothetical protein